MHLAMGHEFIAYACIINIKSNFGRHNKLSIYVHTYIVHNLINLYESNY